ncbi:hypothetical protein EOD42_23330 [Rhodovarius crocodyli]|uniref:Uncharacterized protein n=1 Tax=Rhodovarius crocodyli TaxID=1979269 RepID=A0A437LZB8_9PROT|nr:hypothetical protein [Rhodovarius crocodyli]RVT90737.1 hypothetical protein EOD42_23330 [Rhodovarius crocodyli]
MWILSSAGSVLLAFGAYKLWEGYPNHLEVGAILVGVGLCASGIYALIKGHDHDIGRLHAKLDAILAEQERLRFKTMPEPEWLED